jgi:hypothetical protein
MLALACWKRLASALLRIESVTRSESEAKLVMERTAMALREVAKVLRLANR